MLDKKVAVFDLLRVSDVAEARAQDYIDRRTSLLRHSLHRVPTDAFSHLIDVGKKLEASPV